MASPDSASSSIPKKALKTALNTVVRDTYIKNSAGLSYVIFSLCLQA